MIVFWDVATFSLVETDHHFPDDTGDKHLWNVGQFLLGCTGNIPEDSGFGFEVYITTLFTNLTTT
jgi:hypothetical protein